MKRYPRKADTLLGRPTKCLIKSFVMMLKQFELKSNVIRLELLIHNGFIACDLTHSVCLLCSLLTRLGDTQL